jgi:hypothetical protein
MLTKGQAHVEHQARKTRVDEALVDLFANATVAYTYNGLHPSLDVHTARRVNSSTLLPGSIGKPENSATIPSLLSEVWAPSSLTLAGKNLPKKSFSGGAVQAPIGLPITTGGSECKQLFPQIVVHVSDTSWGHFADYPVVLRNMLTFETIAIRCIVCGTNKKKDNAFIIGVTGIWSHMAEGHASSKPELQEGESKEGLCGSYLQA